MIRRETEADYRQVEQLIRKAFWNVYAPGCSEHYLAHTMRQHQDFIPELDLVAELDGQLVGSIMYTKARLTEASGKVKEILTFGPIAVLPQYQRKGIGKQLILASFEQAEAMGFDTVVIFGNPDNYVGRGFQSCRRHQVHLPDGSFPSAMLVKELKPGCLAGGDWTYRESSAMAAEEQAVQQFDQQFEPMEKKWMPSQETFYIHSHSVIR